MLWLYKYKPVFEEIPHDTKKILDFVLNYKKQKRKSLMIHGPPGTGKTAAVVALAEHLDLELLEVNASDVRNADQINSKIGAALKQQSLFSKGKLILVDELDGISGVKDRGGTAALGSLLADSHFPVILIANDADESKLKSLRSKSVVVEFPAVPLAEMSVILDKILVKENLTAESGVVKSLARRSGGDLRGAIIDLQVLSAAGLSSDVLNSLSERHQTESIKQALVRIFKSTDPKVALDATGVISEDAGELMFWIDENLPKEYSSPADLARAYEALSRADVFNGRIRKREYWRFLSYVFTLLSAGVAVAKDKKPVSFVNYQQTQRLLKYWLAKRKFAKRDSVAAKFAVFSHCSKRKAREILPFIKAAAKNSDVADAISVELDLDSEESGWLSG